MKRDKSIDLIGCCGLYCGLCSKYQSKSPSRCSGCKLGAQHSWCSIWNCCVKKHGFETCAECAEVFNCPVFIRRKVAEWNPAANNIRKIINNGIKSLLIEQKERQALLEKLLRDYNEGRSMNHFCKTCSRMPVDLINKALDEVNVKLAEARADRYDIRLKASSLKLIINELALKNGINLS